MERKHPSRVRPSSKTYIFGVPTLNSLTSLSSDGLTFTAVLLLFVSGLLATGAGFMGLTGFLEIESSLGSFMPALSAVLLLPIVSLIFLGRLVLTRFSKADTLERVLLAGLAVIWLSHLLQVFTPETGFDALWYHLPVAQAVIQQGHFIYLPELYQSVNPLFSDSIFFLGYQIGGEIGAKGVAFLFGLLLVAVSYQLSRTILSRQLSLVAVLMISTIQVVAWQSSSFYVDLAKAVWELSALWLILLIAQDIFKQRLSIKLKNQAIHNLLGLKVLLAGLFFGASLATKQFSILLMPIFSLLLWMVLGGFRQQEESNTTYKKMSVVALFILSSIMMVAPYYYYSFQATGNPVFSLSLHINQLSEIGGESSLANYIWQRTMLLPLAPFFALTARDYIAPILFMALPLVVVWRRQILKNNTLTLLATFVLAQLAVWWYLPPLSTRYALSGFVVLIILLTWTLKRTTLKSPTLSQYLPYLFALIILINFIPRLYVNWRSLQYLSGRQTKVEYLEQFLDGNIDQVLKKWHRL
jgi:hypothetical protein